MNLKSAIDEQGIKGDEHYHSAMSDARYTAKIMKKLDFDRVKKFCSIDTFTIPESRKDEVYLNFGTYEKYISKDLRQGTRLQATELYVPANAFMWQDYDKNSQVVCH